jgi:large subunit ribosomal protein L24
MNKLRLNDEVIVLAGKDKGKKGKLLNINTKTNRVIVEGVNKVKKAMRPTQENPNGGILDVEKAIHISNIALVSPKTGTATRVKIADKGGKKVRVAIKCDSEL